ncbi:hypothetical protein C8R44DRAFT_194186 [Mycena epipterygia]|nr:hypothetical protein C8R44DRAFT_194186 [Mycena epipterygia]
MNSSAPRKGPPGGPKYINDFSKALAGEMKILLAEVGKLRDEKRALQFEIAELMSIKAKHSEGLYAPGWEPGTQLQVAPAEPAPPAAPAPGGWRTVHPPHVPRRKQQQQLQQQLQQQQQHQHQHQHQQQQQQQQLSLRGKPAKSRVPPQPAPAPEPNLPAWAHWRPNPLLAPGAPAGPSMDVVSQPPRSGIFGPSTPPPN